MGNKNLYETVKNKICDEIFAGRYEDGDKIPPERELEELLGVSRVTVRKSLEILEEDGLIVREVGRGTRITLRNRGNVSDLDMIVLIAPARNPFFSEFIGRFQNYAQTKDCLLLYVEKPRKETLEKSLYRLYKRGLRNVVIWLEDLSVDMEKLRRLRALGMNMVFFDSDKGLPYADCVALNNELAIKTLYEELIHRGYKQITYAGWDLQDAYSIRMRQQAYEKQAQGKESIITLPWKAMEKSEEIIAGICEGGREQQPDAVICSDRESGELAVRTFRKLGADIQVSTVDELSAGDRQDVLMYRQKLGEVVEQIFTCLQEQCSKERDWKAGIYLKDGEIC